MAFSAAGYHGGGGVGTRSADAYIAVTKVYPTVTEWGQYSRFRFRHSPRALKFRVDHMGWLAPVLP